MKNLTIAFLLTAGFLIGCKDQMVDPIHVDGSLDPKVLEFRGFVKNAGVAEFPANAEVKGAVQYILRPAALGKGAARIYDVDLETSAEVKVPATETTDASSYSAAGRSGEQIQIGDSGNAILTLAYRIEGSDALAYLHLTFTADESRLKFNKAWISSSDR